MDQQLSSSVSLINWRKNAKDINGGSDEAFDAASLVEDLLDFALERAERSVLQLKTDRASVNCTGQFFEGKNIIGRNNDKRLSASFYEPSVTKLEPSMGNSLQSSSPPSVHNRIVPRKPVSNKTLIKDPIIPWKAFNRKNQPIDSRNDVLAANHIFHAPSKATEKSSSSRHASKTSSVASTNGLSLHFEKSKLKDKKKLNNGSRKLSSVQKAETSCSSVTTNRLSSSVLTPVSSSARSPLVSRRSHKNSQYSGESDNVDRASVFESALSTVEPKNAFALKYDQGFLLNFDIMVKDPRNGTTRPMHFVAECKNFEVNEVFVNGKRLG